MNRKILLTTLIFCIFLGLTACSKNIATKYEISDYSNNVTKEKFYNEFNNINNFSYNKDFIYEFGSSVEERFEVRYYDVEYMVTNSIRTSTENSSIDYDEGRITSKCNTELESKGEGPIGEDNENSSSECDESYQDYNGRFTKFNNITKTYVSSSSFYNIISSFFIDLKDEYKGELKYYIDNNIYTIVESYTQSDNNQKTTTYQYIFYQDSIIFVEKEISTSKRAYLNYTHNDTYNKTEVKKISFEDVKIKAVNPDKYDKY